jgi:uncharacterized protein (DUF2235 family)
MATHVVCLDGTNQTKSQSCPTNIAHIFDSLGGAQVGAGNGSYETVVENPLSVAGKYLPGVGAIGSLPLRALGNLFGDGIAEPIIRGYTFLSRSWHPGDDVVIIGFSRGATAARALAGFVVKQGLLEPAKYDPTDKDEAYKRAIAAWYLYRKGRPDLANQARLAFIERLTGELPSLQVADFKPPIKIACVAVFDTVSSLGLPHLDLEGQTKFDFSICDTDLSPNVTFGFHALAADERRELFTPTFWAQRDGVVQEIFPGGHSDVGGGYAERGLSDCALEWMLAQLNGVRNIFLPGNVKHEISPNSADVAHDDSRVFPFMVTPSRVRAFPRIAMPSGPLRQRVNVPVETLPGTIKVAYSPRGTYADGSKLI